MTGEGPSRAEANVPPTHEAKTRQERVIERTIRITLPDVERVAFDDDGEHIHLTLRPTAPVPEGKTLLTSRLSDDARRYLLGELSDEQFAGIEFRLLPPEVR